MNWFENSIYEAGTFRMKQYSKDFIEAFLTPTKYEYPLKDGMNDIEYSGIKSHMARKALLVAFEIEDGVWSLNLAQEPNVIVCQIDHKKKMLRAPEPVSDEAKTAFYYATVIFNKLYVKDYNKKRSQVGRQHDDDYTKSGNVIGKDFTNAKYITKFDLKKFWT